MLLKIAFEKDAIGMLHHQNHTQISYVSKGLFEVEIDETSKLLKGGDVFMWHQIWYMGLSVKKLGNWWIYLAHTESIS